MCTQYTNLEWINKAIHIIEKEKYIFFILQEKLQYFTQTWGPIEQYIMINI